MTDNTPHNIFGYSERVIVPTVGIKSFITIIRDNDNLIEISTDINVKRA